VTASPQQNDPPHAGSSEFVVCPANAGQLDPSWPFAIPEQQLCLLDESDVLKVRKHFPATQLAAPAQVPWT
jgi:hypothetical protein